MLDRTQLLLVETPLPSLHLTDISRSPFATHDDRISRSTRSHRPPSPACSPCVTDISTCTDFVWKTSHPGPYTYNLDTSWVAYPARRSFVRFRKRSSAKRRRSFERRLSVTRRPPSQLLQNVLHSQYDVCCQRRDDLLPDRLAAIFYCWFLGWIADVYDSFSDAGTDHSFARWTLACSIISMAAFLVVALAVTMMASLLQFVFEVMLSALYFSAMLVVVVVIVIACISIANFDWTVNMCTMYDNATQRVLDTGTQCYLINACMLYTYI